MYRGTSNAHKIAVLEKGMKYQQVGIPPEEAQFLETRKFQINEIARLYRIPPHMVGDLEKSSFLNIEQQSLEFVKYTLDPWVIRWEQSLQKALLLPGEKGKYFIIGVLLYVPLCVGFGKFTFSDSGDSAKKNMTVFLKHGI